MMEKNKFFKYSSMIMLASSLLLIITLILFLIISALTKAEFQEIASAILPSMAGYLPLTVGFVAGDLQVKPGTIWPPFAWLILLMYILYFSLIETLILIYGFWQNLELDTIKYAITTMHGVFGFLVGGIFVKQLTSSAAH
jgi:hypothetical protein